MRVSGPKFFYTVDFAGVHVGPYSLAVYWHPRDWLFTLRFNKMGAGLCIGPIVWLWYSKEVPF